MGDYFKDFVGQNDLKNRLNLYVDGYKATGIFGKSLVCGRRGSGKTSICRMIGQALETKNFIEINGPSYQKLDDFFDGVIASNVDQKEAVLFVDEIHALGKPVKEALLKILDTTKSEINKYTHNGYDYTFDFRRFVFIAATTNPEQLDEPLKDRFGLHRFDLADYSDDELVQVLIMNSECQYETEVLKEIIGVSRRNCRRLVDFANDFKQYLAQFKTNLLTKSLWLKYKEKVGIFPLGLNSVEVKYLNELGKRLNASLTMMAACLDLSPKTIRTDTETYLIKENLIKIDGKRYITGRGRRILDECLGLT